MFDVRPSIHILLKTLVGSHLHHVNASNTDMCLFSDERRFCIDNLNVKMSGNELAKDVLMKV